MNKQTVQPAVDVVLQAPETEEQRRVRLLSMVRTRHDSSQLGRSAIWGGSARFRYYWVHRDDKAIGEEKERGAEVVTSGDAEVKTHHKQEDGRHYFSDVILMRMDKDLAEAYVLKAEDDSLQRLRGSRNEVERFAQRHGIPLERLV